MIALFSYHLYILACPTYVITAQTRVHPSEPAGSVGGSCWHFFHESASKNDILCTTPRPVSTKRIFLQKVPVWSRQNATCVQKHRILQWVRSFVQSDSKINSTLEQNACFQMAEVYAIYGGCAPVRKSCHHSPTKCSVLLK